MPADNFRGMRADVIENLREIGTSIVRWPGGNFAGEYRWRGLTHGKIESRYAGSFYSPGDPPWRTMSQSHRYNINFTGAGGWLSDHCPYSSDKQPKCRLWTCARYEECKKWKV